MYCENCGMKIVEGSEFCTECGTKLNNNLKNNKKNNGLRIASIVLGILGIFFGISFLFSVFGFILSLIGLILGICALRKGKNILGIILNVIGILISVIIFVLLIIGVRRFFSLNIDDYLPETSVDNKYDFSSINLDVLFENDIPIEMVLDRIDKIILVKKYPEDDDMIREVNNTAEYYYNMYEQYYDYSKDEFLSNYGYENENEFIESLKLGYRRNKYFDDYVEKLVTDKEIYKYYKDEVFGDVDSKHILVKIDKDSENGLSDEEAKKLANEIISKLNDGKTWEEVTEEYKDKVVTEELGYMAFNASLEVAYLKECKDLEVGNYSKNPVLTSYGYHIVYKIAQKDKPSLDEVRDEVKDVLATQKKNDDTNLYYKALIKMREEAGFSFHGTRYEELYSQYIVKNK